MKKIIVLVLGILISLSLVGGVKAASYDIYVDCDNATGIEDGTEAHPYNTIAEAIDAAELNSEDNRKIYVAAGTYREKLKLTDYIELYGAGDSETILYGKDSDDDRFRYVVKMYNHTKLKDVQVKEGTYGVVINDYDKAKIEDCKIKKYEEIGIYVEKGKREDKDLFTLEDTKIYDGEGKGLYIRGRKILLEDNEIYENEEEGIDLRSKVKGKIKNNEIYDNHEGGIELEVREVNLKITSNDIDGNHASGVNTQYRGENKKGDITLKRNDIKDSGSYAINCSIPAGGKPPIDYFSSSITLLMNEYEDNANLYGPMCHF